MENNNEATIVKYVQEKMHELYSVVNYDEDLMSEIELNLHYLTRILLDKYAREIGIQQIRNLRLSKEGNNVFGNDEAECISNSLNIFRKDVSLPKGTSLRTVSPKLHEAMEQVGMNEDINIMEDITNELKKKLNSLETSLRSKIYIKQSDLKYCQDIKDCLFLQVQSKSLDERYDKNELRKFATEIGIISNEILISMFGVPAVELHNLIDVDELLDKLEQGVISKREKNFIFQEDYATRFLKYYNGGEFEKSRELIQYIKPESIKELFRKHNVGVESIIILCNEMISTGVRKDKIRAEINELVYTNNKKKSKIFALTPLQILKFVKADFLEDTYLMDAYHTQQKMKEEIEEKSPSVRLYKQDEIFIDERDIKEIFDAHRLLKHYFKGKTFEKALAFYGTYIFSTFSTTEKIEFEKDVLSNNELEPKDIIKVYKEYNLLRISTFKKLKTENSELQKAYLEYLKQADLRGIFDDVENGITTEEELIDIFGDKYYDMVQTAISHNGIAINSINKITFLDSGMIIDEYKKSTAEKELYDKNDDYFNFRDIFNIYLVGDNLIELKHIIKLLEEQEDPVMKVDDFDISTFFYDCIVELKKGYDKFELELEVTNKIKELYLNGLLAFDALAQLSEQGIISSEVAQEINKELCSQKLIEDLQAVNLGGSIENESNTTKTNACKTYKRGNNSKDYLKMPDKTSLVSQQTEVMLEILKQYGYEPLSTQPNVYGFSEIQTFHSGNFEDYMVLLSEEIPEVAVLMHSKHVEKSDIYYQTGGNATYILSTAKLKEYLEQLGVISSKFSHLNMTKQSMKTDDPYLRTANVTKNWGRNVPKKIYEVLHMLEQPVLEEYSNSIRKSKTSSFNPEIILPKNISDKAREERLEAITMFNNELAELKEQIENDENHGY